MLRTALPRRVNRRAGALIGLVGRRAMIASALAGLLAALVTGSILLAAAPVLALTVVQLLRVQPVERLFVMALVATIGFDHPSEQPFMGRWVSPVKALGQVWFHPVATTVPMVPLPLAPSLLVIVWLTWRATTERRPAPGATAKLYLRASGFAAITLLAAQAYGIARGGDARQTFYQVAPLLLTTMVGVTAALIATPSLLRRVEQVILVVAAVRAMVCLYVYVTVFRPTGESFLYVTTHSDSVLWVVALALVLAKVLATFRQEPQRARAALALLLLAAITANNRRLAWVELGVVVGYAVWAMPLRLRRLRNRVGIIALPFLLAYTVAGLAAPPSRIFMPVQALNSVNDDTDSSTLSREIEISNLFVTIRQGGPLGTGFGHEYTEQIVGPDIATLFPQYRYLPHNSTLALLAFAGIVGFIGFWLPFVVAMGAAARLRDHRARQLRAAGMWSAGAIIAHTLMAWGDIGLQSSLSGMLGALGAGLAVRFVSDRPDGPSSTESAPAAPTAVAR